jgi:hypothetical protein
LDKGAERAPGLLRWTFAAAAGALLVVGAAAYAARAWIDASATGRPEPSIASWRESALAPPLVAPEPPEGVAPATIVRSGSPRPRRFAERRSAATAIPTNAELQLLRAAREDVTRGDFAGALVAVAEHTRKFRNGSLTEEREALRVKSLAGLGRRDEARRAAAAFHARFPHSAYLSTLDRTRESDR